MKEETYKIKERHSEELKENVAQIAFLKHKLIDSTYIPETSAKYHANRVPLDVSFGPEPVYEGKKYQPSISSTSKPETTIAGRQTARIDFEEELKRIKDKVFGL